MKLQKYLTILKISFQQEFAYKLNFVMWRVRNVVQVFVIFFFWESIFIGSSGTVFGYDRARILTYIFAILFIRAVVFSARAVDISGQISNGELSNMLLKPVGFIKYWFSRDLASKALNLIFAVIETSFLYLLLRPPFFFQTDPMTTSFFVVFLVLAIMLFYFLLFITNMITFWMPESGWAAQFLFIAVIAEFLSGAIFPIDIFPELIRQISSYLPFQYLIFFPIQVYLGKVTGVGIMKGLVVAVTWMVLLYFLMKKIWARGLKNYASEGR